MINVFVLQYHTAKKKNRTKKKLAPQRGTNRRRIPYRYSWINLLLSVWAKAKAPTEDMKQIYILFINNRKTDVEYRKTNEKKTNKTKTDKQQNLISAHMKNELRSCCCTAHTTHTHAANRQHKCSTAQARLPTSCVWYKQIHVAVAPIASIHI